ncbi:MAG: hypothetical protein RL213_435 [Bacteroidota bacterium]|jgi:WD40 repeat protein
MISVTRSRLLLGHEGSVYALERAHLSGKFFSGSSDRIVSMWSLEGDEPPSGLVNVGAIVYSLRLVPEKSWLLIGTSSGNLHVVDLVAGREIRNIAHHAAGIFDIRYSNSHDRIYTAGGDGKIAFWRLSDLALVRSVPLCKEKVRSLELSPSGNELLAACGDGNIYFLDPESGVILRSFHAHGLSANAVALDPKGERLFTGGRDAHFNVWDASTLELVRSIPAHNYAIYAFAFSPDKRLIATASRDKTVKLWDMETTDFLLRIDRDKSEGHRNSVNKIIWLDHPAGLVSAGDDRAIMSWDVKSDGSY